MNAWAFATFGWDKRAAVRGRPRVSEASLLLLAFFGGAAGAWLGVYAFRHKTMKLGFRIGLLIATLGCLGLVGGILRYLLQR
ncbi:MAG: DUF1294 domain-containing protein [Planctomycetota bacterium]|nr:MAG: DUF1294 domain-containing protein [Planctomycetota bacterium]